MLFAVNLEEALVEQEGTSLPVVIGSCEKLIYEKIEESWECVSWTKPRGAGRSKELYKKDVHNRTRLLSSTHFFGHATSGADSTIS